MTEPTHGSYEVAAVDGIETLQAALRRVDAAPTVSERVDRVADLLMNGHEGVSGYLTFGNNKIADNTGIFNMNSATDCPNAKTRESGESETGLCQVPWQDCYAHTAENVYPDALKKRRLQEYLWDSIDAETFGNALLRVKTRKRSAFDYLRVSESGDFRHDGDITKVNRIADIVAGQIQVYTYSASHKLDWTKAPSDNFVVNQSNDLADYGDRLFTAVPTETEIPDDGIFCPFEAAKRNGVDTEQRPQCGECTYCISPESEQNKDVYITIH